MRGSVTAPAGRPTGRLPAAHPPASPPAPAQVWTNGRFRSTRHRVVNALGRQRLSAPFFFEPSFDPAVAPLQCCVTAERPARYAATTSGGHLLERYGATHASYSAGSGGGGTV